MIRLVILFLCLFRFLSCVALDDNPIEDKLRKYISHQSARIGVAVISEDGCVIGVNQHESFPMLSVMKFPLALTVLETVKEKHHSLLDTIPVCKSQLHTDTYSPMLLKYTASKDHYISIYELLDYALKSSDNNACDILFRHVVGIEATEKYIQSLGIKNFAIRVNEQDMYENNAASYKNWNLPLSAALLINKLFTEPLYDSVYQNFLKETLISCTTGKNRLSKPLVSRGGVIGHKTGTGFNSLMGLPQGINDVGFVRLPNGRHYAIAVFIRSAFRDMHGTEQIIADISEIVYKHIMIESLWR